MSKKYDVIGYDEAGSCTAKVTHRDRYIVARTLLPLVKNNTDLELVDWEDDGCFNHHNDVRLCLKFTHGYANDGSEISPADLGLKIHDAGLNPAIDAIISSQNSLRVFVDGHPSNGEGKLRISLIREWAETYLPDEVLTEILNVDPNE